MKYALLACLALVAVAMVWDRQQFNYGRLAELADSAEGVDAITARKFFRESLIDVCHDTGKRAQLTQLSASDCELAVKNKDILCDMKMQMTREQTVRSEQDFRSYGETYLECLYPDDTKYVTDRSLPKASEFKQ